LKKILVIVLLLIVLAAAGGYYYVQRFLDDPARMVKALPEVVNRIEFELDNVRYGHTRSGVKKWELSTRKAKRIKGQDGIILEGVTARIYAEGKLDSDTRIEADKGSYQVESGDIELQGTVKIINQQFQIETERLSYKEAREEIMAPESLVVRSEKLTIKANRATIDLKKQQLHFSGSVKARIQPGKISAAAGNAGNKKIVHKLKPDIDVKKQPASGASGVDQ
jgi:LPS export ABC transporter protein LptC